MVAVPFEPKFTSSLAIEATLTLSHHQSYTREVGATVTAVGWRGLILGSETALRVASTGYESGDHAWLELPLPTGESIRPLVQLSPREEGGAAARIVHLLPSDRRSLEAFHATRSASY